LDLPIDVTNKDGGNGTEKLAQNNVKTKRRRSLTREGCVACTFKRTTKGEIFKVDEGHTHPLAIPSKILMLKCSRDVNLCLK